MLLPLLLGLVPVSAQKAANVSQQVLNTCAARMDGQLPYAVPFNFQYSGNVRRYYVATEQVTWDYVPTGWDNWMGVPIEDSPRATSYTQQPALGLHMQKAKYVGYTDATYTNKTQQPDHLGIQGPIIRAEVGDMIEIMLINRLPYNYAAMHSMGLYYTKESEGSLYFNGTDAHNMTSLGDAIPPGGCFTYKWLVTDESKPNPPAESVLWSYHPYINIQSDLAAGTIGPVAIYSPGKMAEVMAARREFFVLYNIFRESDSYMAYQNAKLYGNATYAMGLPSSGNQKLLGSGRGNSTLYVPMVTNMPNVTVSSSILPNFYALNGYMFDNIPSLKMCLNDPVTWYVYAFGQASHVFHLHGNNFLNDGQFKASMNMNDGQMRTAFMNATNPGDWNFICHVNNHLEHGMEASYVTYDVGQCPLMPVTTPANVNGTHGSDVYTK